MRSDPSRRSTVTAVDVVRDAARTTRSRPGRTLGLALVVALGVATFVAVLSMSDAADLQVQRRIAGLRPELVRLNPTVEADDPLTDFAPSAISSMRAQPGFEAAVIVHTYRDAAVRARLSDDPQQVVPAPILGIEGNLAAATRTAIQGSQLAGQDAAGSADRVLVGVGLADRLHLADVALAPVVWIDGVPFQVIGIITDSQYLAASTDAVVMPRRSALRAFGGSVLHSTAYVRVVKGDADAAAAALPLRLTPQAPERWETEVPRVPLDVAEGISADMRTLSLGMAGVVMAIGIVAIGNAMMRSVFERMPEIGLRRSLGATSGHIVGLLLVEAATVGLVAGAIGILAGVVTALSVGQIHHWPAAVAVPATLGAVPIAIVAGGLAGLLPARTAVRITPTQALRRE